MRRTGAAIAVVTLAGLAGCASIREGEAIERGRLLVSAGFDQQFADTLEKRDALAALTQHKLVTHPRDGEDLYVYADALGCQCLYVGDDAAYQRYRKLVVDQRFVHLRDDAAGFNEDAPMNWSLWRDPRPGW